MAKIDGGPAFPLPVTEWNPGYAGMSLRDWFAGQALTGLFAQSEITNASSVHVVAQIAYGMADAMIAARDAQREEGTW